MECAERVVADLGRIIPSTWATHRHKQPGMLRSLRRIIRPSLTVTTAPHLRVVPAASAT
jgi:hypothetical protein